MTRHIDQTGAGSLLELYAATTNDTTSGKRRLSCGFGQTTQLVPHFVKHYKEIGITDFHFIVNISDENDSFKTEAIDCLTKLGIPKDEINFWVGPYTCAGLTENLNATISQYPDDWWVIADIDELHVYSTDLEDVITQAEKEAKTYVTGCWVDRISSTGEMAAVQPIEHASIWEQFPNTGFVYFPMAGAVPYKITLCKGSEILSEGQHSIINAVGEFECNEIIAQVHHFKWTAGVAPRMQPRLDNMLSQNEIDKMPDRWVMPMKASVLVAHYLSVHNQKIDLDNPLFLISKPKEWQKECENWQEIVDVVSVGFQELMTSDHLRWEAPEI